MADSESFHQLSVTGAPAEGPVTSITNSGTAGTALAVTGGGTLLDVRTNSGASRLKIGQTPPTVSGAKGSNAALGSLIAALVAAGLIIDTTTT